MTLVEGQHAPVYYAALLSALLLLALAVPMTSDSSSSEVCTKYSSNPILGFSTNSESPGASVVKQDSTYLMWFSGVRFNVSGIFTARSSDGMNWTNFTLVVGPGPSGTWDELVYSPSVIWNGSMYLMYYTGTGTKSYRQVGLAYSRDNINWVKYTGNPILTAGPGFYDSWWGRFANVMLDNGVYKMWYTGHTLTNTSTPWYIAVDYATSPDGVHWTKYPNNPVYGGGASWEDYFWEHPSVVKVGTTYVLLGDDGWAIGYAISSDGIHWSGNKTLISPGTSPSWDNESVRLPSALVNGTEILLWYTGTGLSPLQQNIGLADCSFFLIPSISTLSTTTTITNLSTVTSTLRLTTAQNQTVVAPNSTLSDTGFLAVGGVVGALMAMAAMRKWYSGHDRNQ